MKSFRIIEGSALASCTDCKNTPTKEIVSLKKFLFIKAETRYPFCDQHAEMERQNLLSQGFVFERGGREVVHEQRAPMREPLPATPSPPAKNEHVVTMKKETAPEVLKVIIEIDLKDKEGRAVVVKKDVSVKKKKVEVERDI